MMLASRIKLVLATIAISACAEQPRRETTAVVINIGPGSSPKWDTDKLQITAQSPDGLLGTKSIPAGQLACRVGDKVRGSARGVMLELDERACTHRQ